MNGRIEHTMPETEYHAHPSLSSTGARKLLDSPARYRWTQDHPQQHTATFDLGSAVHAKVLGVGWGIEELDYPDYRTKAAQTARDEAREAGLIPMLSKELVIVHDMAESLLADSDARPFFEQAGAREVSVFGEVDGVPVRARFDILTDAGAGVDVKTTINASPAAFERSVARYGYDVQDAWYDDTHAAATGHRLTGFHFLAVEKTPPYLVAVYDLEPVWREKGREKARKARDTYRACTESGIWPGYAKRTLMAPAYLIYEDEDMYEEIR